MGIALAEIVLLLLTIVIGTFVAVFISAGPQLRRALRVSGLLAMGGGGVLGILGVLWLSVPSFDSGVTVEYHSDRSASDAVSGSHGSATVDWSVDKRRPIADKLPSIGETKGGFSIELRRESVLATLLSEDETSQQPSDEALPSDEIPEGMRVITFRIDDWAEAHRIRLGDRIDVQVQAEKNLTAGVLEAGTWTFARGIQVFSVGAIVLNEGGDDAEEVRTVSLLVTRNQIGKFRLASEIGDIHLVRRTAADEAVSKPLSKQPIASSASVPPWLQQSPRQTAKVQRVVIEAGPYATVKECRNEIDEKLLAAAADYLDEQVLYGDRRLLEISLGMIRREVVADDYLKSETKNFGPLADDQEMYTLYNLLEFNEGVNEQFARLARQATIGSRLTYAGFGLVGLLVLVTTVFGYLRLDAMTGGQYKRFLQWGVVSVVIAVAAGGWLLTQIVALG